jgi:hypothetical protein
MKAFYEVFALTILSFGFFGIAATPCDAQIPNNAAQERPCGGSEGFLSKLIPQGWKGADFKPACITHDDCYDTYGAERAACDERLRQSLLASCENSRRPRQCKRVVRLMHKGVRKFGEKGFRKWQEVARINAGY